MKKHLHSPLFKLLYCIIFVFIIKSIGTFFLDDSMTWYQSLKKPFLSPPDYVFAPIWNVLYLTIAISLWKFWITKTKKSKKLAFTLFFTQMFFNAIWTFLFFYLQSIFLGLLDIILLDISIIFTIILFSRISLFSALILIPYALWVLFATYLNISYFILN
jgi:tryptophan-rich sensory protein